MPWPARYLPKARPPERSGVAWLPDGGEVYERAIAKHTTLDTTPMAVHQIGLDAIASLADEYRDLGGRVLGTTDLAEILDRLRNDPTLRFAEFRGRAVSCRRRPESGSRGHSELVRSVAAGRLRGCRYS